MEKLIFILLIFLGPQLAWSGVVAGQKYIAFKENIEEYFDTETGQTTSAYRNIISLSDNLIVEVNWHDFDKDQLILILKDEFEVDNNYSYSGDFKSRQAKLTLALPGFAAFWDALISNKSSFRNRIKTALETDKRTVGFIYDGDSQCRWNSTARADFCTTPEVDAVVSEVLVHPNSPNGSPRRMNVYDYLIDFENQQ